MSAVSVIIPAYNEELAIGSVIERLRKAVPGAEIIVVDDGSTDGTVSAAEVAGVQVIRRPGNGGYGRSIKDGVTAAAHDTIVITDADGTYPIEEIPALLSKKEAGFDMVVGARQGKFFRGSLLKRAARFCLKLIVEFATGRRIPDVNSGLRVFSKAVVLPLFPDICEGFSFSTTITLLHHLTHRSVAYLPITYERRTGSSKVSHFHDTLRTLQYITECLIHYNPLKLTILLSFTVFAVGLVSWIWFGTFAAVEGFFFASFVFAMGCVMEGLRRPRR